MHQAYIFPNKLNGGAVDVPGSDSADSFVATINHLPRSAHVLLPTDLESLAKTKLSCSAFASAAAHRGHYVASKESFRPTNLTWT